MFYSNVCWIIICRIFPNNLSNKSLFSKHLITKSLQISLLIIINRYKYHAIVSQQVTGKRQTRQHKGEPRGMASTSTTSHRENALCTLTTYIQAFGKFLSSEVELVIIHKAIRASVIRRVDINHLHFAAIRLHQMLQRIQIITTDIYILAILVLWLSIMLLVRTNERSGVHVGKHTSVVLAQPIETACLIRNGSSSRQCSLESLYVKFAVSMKALREVLLQRIHFFLSRYCISVVIHYIFYHIQFFLLLIVHGLQTHQVVHLHT